MYILKVVGASSAYATRITVVNGELFVDTTKTKQEAMQFIHKAIADGLVVALNVRPYDFDMWLVETI